jgi:hypothetical protein
MYISNDNHELRKALLLSIHEMAVLHQIFIMSRNHKYDFWCVKTKPDIAKYLDLSVSCVEDCIRSLKIKGYLIVPIEKKYNDSRIRPSEFIEQIAESQDLSFILKDGDGHVVIASASMQELAESMPSKRMDMPSLRRDDAVKKKGSCLLKEGLSIKEYQNNNKDIFQNSLSQGSIAESDMSLSNNESIQSNTIGSSMGVCKENVREQIVSAPYARIGVSKERHDELKETFEAFRVEYRKSNGSVMGLDKEFENLKKCHPKTWHEVVPTLLDKLKDQNEQRKAQREEQKFTPELPMLSRYVKEQMWDRHYYTSTKQSEPKKTIANFTPDQLT